MEQQSSSVRAPLARREVLEDHKLASIGKLLAGIVHEINTPVGSILSNNEVIIRSLELLRKSLGAERTDLSKAREVVETCRNLAAVDKIACEQISSIVRGLKVFIRQDSSELREADLGAHLMDTLKLLHGDFRRRILLDIRMDKLPPVECYPQMISQVFLNLLVNAGQAIEGEGKIGIAGNVAGEQVHIVISDTGKGIPPELRHRIFESGFTTKPIGLGTGLGLAISREIVEDVHSGRLDFESEVGTGTKFHICLPIRQRPHR